MMSGQRDRGIIEWNVTNVSQSSWLEYYCLFDRLERWGWLNDNILKKKCLRSWQIGEGGYYRVIHFRRDKISKRLKFIFTLSATLKDFHVNKCLYTHFWQMRKKITNLPLLWQSRCFLQQLSQHPGRLRETSNVMIRWERHASSECMAQVFAELLVFTLNLLIVIMVFHKICQNCEIKWSNGRFVSSYSKLPNQGLQMLFILFILVCFRNPPLAIVSWAVFVYVCFMFQTTERGFRFRVQT